MKKILFVLTLFFLFPSLNFAQIYSNGTGGGAWNSTSTWAGGIIPSSSDGVIIVNGDIVTVNSTQSCSSITVNGSDASNYGTLTLQTGAQLSTTSHTLIYGKLFLIDGEFNEGNSSGDKLTINGANLGSSCLLSISGGTLNVSRYFSLSNSASIEITGGTINVNSSGGSSSTDIFYLPSGTTFTMSSGTINILNGNLGSGVALKFNPTTSNVTGGTINFTNTKDYASTTLISNNTLYDINCKISSGNKLIIQNMPSSSDGFACHNFTVTSGSTEIAPGYGMTVSNTLTNNDTLIVASDATGNGSLIMNGTVSGNNIIVQRHIVGYTASDNGWHLISSPIDGFIISGSDFEPGNASPNLDDFYAWDESSNTWLNYKDGTNNITQFTKGRGYLIAYESTATKNFSGTPVNSNVSLSNLSCNVSQGNGWHLIGNPFTSAIKWNDGSWILTNVSSQAEVYNESTGNYIVLNANDIIPSTNGFFVQVSSSTNTLTIPAAARTHDATGNYKATALSKGIQVKVSGDANTYSDITQVRFLDNATEQWDIELDAHKLTGANTAPQLWTVSNNESFALNSLPTPKENISIPMDFKAGVNSTYHLTWTGMDNMDSNLEFLLEDKQEGITINMADVSNYDFTGNTDDNTSRFSLHINSVSGIPRTSKDKTLVYALGSDVYIKVKNNQNLDGYVSFYNILGQVVDHTALNGTTEQIIRTQLKSGVYLIRIEKKDGNVTTHKIFIK